MSIHQHSDFIKSQIAHHERTIEFLRQRGDHEKVPRHTGILKRFHELLPIIEKIESSNGAALASGPASSAPPDEKKIGARLGDLSDIPDEIKAQLVSVQFDKTEQRILDVLSGEFGGVATIDEIMVGMYRTYNEVDKRDVLATKIYRMTKKDLLYSVPGRKGVYSIEPVSEA